MIIKINFGSVTLFEQKYKVEHFIHYLMENPEFFLVLDKLTTEWILQSTDIILNAEEKVYSVFKAQKTSVFWAGLAWN